MPVLARMIAVLVFLIAPLNSAPTATVSSSLNGTPLPPLKYPKGAVKINLGGRDVMVNQQAMGTGATKATIRAMDEDFAKFITSATNINFDACHQPLVLTSNRFLALGCSTVAAGSAAINDLSWNSGTDTYAWTPSYGSLTAFSATNYFGRSLQDSGNFVYSLKNSTKAATNDVLVYKLDGSVPQSIGSATMVTCTLFASGPQGREINWLADPYIFVVYATATTFAQEGIAVIDKTSMTQVGIYPTAKLNSIVERYRSTQNLFFIANENSATTYGFSKVLIGASPTFGVTVQDFWVTGGSDIVTMWASPLMSTVYVHVAASSPTNLVQLVNAYTMSTEGTLTFTETPVRYAPTLWSTTTGREFYLTIGTTAPGSATMFTRTMVWLDFCLTPGQNPCLQCQAGRYLNSALTENLCITTYDFPAGYGINGFYMGPCLGDLAKGCLVCPATTSVCTVCDTANGFYLETISGQCYSVATMPTGFGLNTGTNLVEACTTANCQKCSSDKTVCTGCATGYYSKIGTTEPCYSGLSNFGLYYGSSAYYLAPCTALNCAACAANYSICTACTWPYLLVEGLYTCEISKEGYGIDSSTPGVLKACKDPRCTDCGTGYLVCKACLGNLILTDNSHCFNTSGYLTSKIKLAKKPSLNTNTGEFTLEFDQEISEVDFVDRLNLEVYGQSNQVIDTHKYQFSMKLTSSKIVQCTLRGSADGLRLINMVWLSHKNSSKLAFFNNVTYYPTDGPIVVYAVYSKTSAQTATQVAASTMTMAASAMAVGTGSGGANAAFFIKVIDSLEYILYMNGVRVLRADNYLHFLSGNAMSFIPVSVTGAWPSNCVPHNNFAREELSCQLLENYSAVLVGISLALLMVLLLTYLQKLSNHLISKKKLVNFCTCYNRVMEGPNKIFKKSLLLVIFEGTQVEAIRFAILNLFTCNDSPWMIAGSTISAIIIVLYCFMGCCMFKGASYVKAKMRVIKSKECLPVSIDTIDFKSAPYYVKVVSVFYEDYKTEGDPKKAHFLWLPLLSLLYNALSQVVLIATAGEGFIQFWGFFTLNIIFLAAVCYFRPFSKKYLNICYILVATFFFLIELCYLVLNYANPSMDSGQREDGFGIPLVILFSATLLVSFIPIAVDLVEFLYKYIIRKNAKTKKFASIVSSRISGKATPSRLKASKKKLLKESNLKPGNPYIDAVSKSGKSTTVLLTGQTSRLTQDPSVKIVPMKKGQIPRDYFETPLMRKKSIELGSAGLRRHKNSDDGTPTTKKSPGSTVLPMNKISNKGMASMFQRNKMKIKVSAFSRQAFESTRKGKRRGSSPSRLASPTEKKSPDTTEKVQI